MNDIQKTPTRYRCRPGSKEWQNRKALRRLKIMAARVGITVYRSLSEEEIKRRILEPWQKHHLYQLGVRLVLTPCGEWLLTFCSV